MIDLRKMLIWRMGPGPTWVGPAPRCGHPGGWGSPLVSTGRRPGLPNAFAGRLNGKKGTNPQNIRYLTNSQLARELTQTPQTQRWVLPAEPYRACAAAQEYQMRLQAA